MILGLLPPPPPLPLLYSSAYCPVFQIVFTRSVRQLRRIENVSRSPMFSLFGETLEVLP